MNKRMHISNGNKRILQIAVPSIISNITVPLLGLVDVTIVGHLGSAAYIGAIAVGGMLFNIIYWIFGFLRMGTSGMTSQAFGQRNLEEVTKLLLRSVGVGLFIALCLMTLQYPIQKAAFAFIQTSDEVERLATLYFRICIWGAPAMLGLYGFAGWFIGMQNSRFPMYIAITQNIVNILASLCFVFLFGMKVEGVALGTLIAQYAGFLMALLLWLRYYKQLRKRVHWRGIWQKQAMYRFFQVNRDIFLRTLCLVAVTMFFTSAGAAQGEVVLAVNTLLMQLFTLFSYIMDGFAYAGEALAGRYIGAGNRMELHRTVRQLFGWGVGLSAGFTLLYGIGGQSFLELLTIRYPGSRHLLLLGISHSPCRIFRLFMGWHFHRCHRYPPDAFLHVHRFCQFFSYLLHLPRSNGKSCLVDGFYYLPVASRTCTSFFSKKDSPLKGIAYLCKKVNQQSESYGKIQKSPVEAQR